LFPDDNSRLGGAVAASSTSTARDETRLSVTNDVRPALPRELVISDTTESLDELLKNLEASGLIGLLERC